MSLHYALRLPDHDACLAAIHAALAAGQDVNGREGFSESTPLNYTAWNREAATAEAAIETLLAAGADVRAKDTFGQEALHSAASNPRAQAAVAAIKALVAAGADLQTKDRHGWEPLHSAVRNWSAEAAVAAMQALLSAGSDAWAVVNNGYTPLWLTFGRSAYPNDLNGQINNGALVASVLLVSGHTDTALEELQYAQLTYAELLLPDFIVDRSPLTAAQWDSVWALLHPADPCPGLGRVLPTALACSEFQAWQVVCRLPPADAQRLRTFLLCLGLLQRRCGTQRRGPVELPPDVVRGILGSFVEA